MQIEILQKTEFPGISPAHPDFVTLGSPFSAFWGEMKLICWAALSNNDLLGVVVEDYL